GRGGGADGGAGGAGGGGVVERCARDRDDAVGAVGQAVAAVPRLVVVVRVPVPVGGVVRLAGAGVLHEMLAPGQVVLGGDHLGVDLGVVARAPLERERAALALAVEVGAAPVHATGHEHVVAPAALEQQVALAVRGHPGLLLPVVDPAHAVGQALGLLGRRAAATRERLDLDAVGLGRQLRVREVGEEAHLAGAGLPAVAEQERGRGAAILRLVAAVVIDAGRDLAAGLVERHAGAQVDGAAEASFDDLGRGVLVHVHAGHQLGRDLLEAQPTAAVRAE